LIHFYKRSKFLREDAFNKGRLENTNRTTDFAASCG